MWWWIRPLFNTGLVFALISYLACIAAQCMEKEGYFYLADGMGHSDDCVSSLEPMTIFPRFDRLFRTFFHEGTFRAVDNRSTLLA